MNIDDESFKEPYSINKKPVSTSKIDKDISIVHAAFSSNVNNLSLSSMVDAKERNIEIEMQNLLKSNNKYNK